MRGLEVDVNSIMEARVLEYTHATPMLNRVILYIIQVLFQAAASTMPVQIYSVRICRCQTTFTEAYFNDTGTGSLLCFILSALHPPLQSGLIRRHTVENIRDCDR